jgi:NAD(P)-dependent dehydrogenase (short-subunit alcohol dehydrogenase family)
MTDPIDLAGKTVIVTGASSGIGASTARLLRTGEESFDVPHGPEQPGLAQASPAA